jgi:hypothetical protein
VLPQTGQTCSERQGRRAQKGGHRCAQLNLRLTTGRDVRCSTVLRMDTLPSRYLKPSYHTSSFQEFVASVCIPYCPR